MGNKPHYRDLVVAAAIVAMALIGTGAFMALIVLGIHLSK